ncbi:MAG: hypothetical protein WBC04_22335 [Candidatus Acidiferrales bacterium]
MKDATYDLFAVDSDCGPLWLESISGLENAKRCMEQRAAESPGDYFVYNAREGAVVARSQQVP